MVLKRRISIEELIKEFNHYYPDMVKFCIDRKRRVVAVDRDMHIEMEHELYDDGSDYSDIFGGNLMIDTNPVSIRWEAHPNIERNRQLGIGAGRSITDQKVVDELTGILEEWIL